MYKVVIADWVEGFNAIQFNKMLRPYGYSLSKAHAAAEMVLDQQPVVVEINSLKEAEAFLAKCQQIGAIGKIEEPSQ